MPYRKFLYMHVLPVSVFFSIGLSVYVSQSKPHYLNYCALIKSLEKARLSILLLFLKIFLAIRGLLHEINDFLVFCSYSEFPLTLPLLCVTPFLVSKS